MPPRARDARTSRDQAVPPAAVRSATPGWRDPRLWVGVVIVAASVIVGARVLDRADDTVTVWAVPTDVGAGQSLDPAQLVATRVHFANADELSRYYRTDDTLPADLTVVHDLGAGELLARSAVGTGGTADLATMSIEAPPGQVPPDLAPGSVVDVFLVAHGDGSAASTTSGTPALDRVRVVDVPTAGDSFSPSTDRQVVVAVPKSDVGPYYKQLASLSDPLVAVVEVG